MTACAECGRDSEARFRFCPWCGTAQRRKLVEFFRAHPNSAGRALRVSRYYGVTRIQKPPAPYKPAGPQRVVAQHKPAVKPGHKPQHKQNKQQAAGGTGGH